VRLLLDTHTWLWWVGDPALLTAEATDAIASPHSDVLVSAASAWEISIKRRLGKLDQDGPLETAIDDDGFTPLPISVAHAVVAGGLPPHHRDPFDRMLVAQAQVEDLTLVTRDPRFQAYDVPILAA
jgi:PIN domain nuclease of toxin-antitoxin system